MKLPDSVKVGNHIYTIGQQPDLKDANGEYLGYVERVDLDIQIRENIPNSLKVEVLTHEIIHALLGETPIYNHEDNEAITVSLTVPLVNFIVDNPHFIKFVQKELKRGQTNTARKPIPTQRRPQSKSRRSGGTASEGV